MDFREVKVEPYLQQPICHCGSDLKYDGGFGSVTEPKRKLQPMRIG
jgi:hypothetical protein